MKDKEKEEKRKLLSKIKIFKKKEKKSTFKEKIINFFKKINVFKKVKVNDTFSYKEVMVIVIFSMGIGGLCIYSLINVLSDGNYLTISKDFNKLVDTYNTINDKYYGKVDKNELIDNAIAGMLTTVSDPYTTYIDKETTKEFLEKVNGTYNGIGCEVYTIDNKVVIGTVFEDSPSAKAGLKTGDIILEIDGSNYEGKTSQDMANYVKKSSTDIKLKIQRGEETKEVKLKPKQVEIPSISTEIYEKNNKKVGYLYISIFSAVTDTQFEKELEIIEAKGIDSLIIDVRQNTGGYLDVVTKITNLLLPKGKVIYQLEDNDGIRKKYVTNKEERKYKIAVLIDGVSASASEILAAAIKESYGGYLVGQNTYGKGTVQQTYDLEDGSMIKYTTQKWLTPNGNWINEVGVEPTHKVELSENYFNNPSMETDDQFQKALELVSE